MLKILLTEALERRVPQMTVMSIKIAELAARGGITKKDKETVHKNAINIINGEAPLTTTQLKHLKSIGVEQNHLPINPVTPDAPKRGFLSERDALITRRNVDYVKAPAGSIESKLGHIQRKVSIGKTEYGMAIDRKKFAPFVKEARELAAKRRADKAKKAKQAAENKMSEEKAVSPKGAVAAKQVDVEMPSPKNAASASKAINALPNLAKDKAFSKASHEKAKSKLAAIEGLEPALSEAKSSLVEAKEVAKTAAKGENKAKAKIKEIDEAVIESKPKIKVENKEVVKAKPTVKTESEADKTPKPASIYPPNNNDESIQHLNDSIKKGWKQVLSLDGGISEYSADLTRKLSKETAKRYEDTLRDNLAGISHYDSKWLDPKDINPNAPPPTLQQVRDIYAYTGTSTCQSMNGTLRGIYENSEIENLAIKMAQRTSDALKTLPNYEGTVYRGTSIPVDLVKNLQVGSIYSDPGFLSTSADKGVATGFGSAYGGNVSVLLQIEGKHQGKNVDPVSAYKGVEKEVLFDANSHFKVTKISKDPDGKKRPVIHLEQINPPKKTLKQVAKNSKKELENRRKELAKYAANPSLLGI
jgi:hypothetical protein